MLEKFKKIKPYGQAHFSILKRKLYEFIGNDRFSKPYKDHGKLLKYINKKGGIFIAGGGNDGYFEDPTYYLERFSAWTGFIIEPTKIKKYCKINRPNSTIFDVALVSHDFKEDNIKLIDCNAMTVVKDSFEGYKDWVKAGEKAQNLVSKEITAPVATLDSLIDKYFSNHPFKQIDLLTLDLEGFELEALKGLNLNKNKPEFLLIEIHNSKRKEEIENYIGEHYTFVELLDSRDYLYKNKK